MSSSDVCFEVSFDVDPPPDPLPDGPEEHGTRAYYVRKRCRCLRCREANRLYAAELERERKDPVAAPRMVDAAAVRDHLLRLSQAGLGLRKVEARCGVSRHALSEIRSGKTNRVRAATKAAIMAVVP